MTRPRPVLTTAGFAGLVQGIAAVLAFLGYSQASTSLSNESQTLISVGLGVGSVLFHTLPALYAQMHVTPLIDPKNAVGQTLVPVSALPAVATPSADVIAALEAANTGPVPGATVTADAPDIPEVQA